MNIAQRIFINAKGRQILYWTLAVSVLCAVLNFFFNQSPGNDTAIYYSRLAFEFGQNRYDVAFLHFIPPLIPFLAGLLAKTGFDGWASMKLVSGLFFIGAVYWSFRLARHRLDDRAAQWCSVLFLLCYRLLKYGMAGQLDSGKMFLLLFTFERLLTFLQTGKKGTLLLTAGSAALLALTRNEGLGYLPLVFGLVFFADWIRPSGHGGGLRRAACGAGRCAAVLAVCLMVWSPWLIYQYRTTGYPLLSSKHIPVLVKLFPKAGLQSPFEEGVPLAFTQEQPVAMRISSWKDPQLGSLPFKVIATVDGLYWFYFPFAVYGGWVLIRRRQWIFMDTLLLVMFLWHVAMHWIFAPSILARLVIPGIPFYFPFAVAGFADLGRRLALYPENRVRCRLAVAVLTALAIAFIVKGMQRVRKAFDRQDRVDIEIASWIAENRERLDTNPVLAFESSKKGKVYSTGRQPVVLSARPAVPMRSASDAAAVPEALSQEDFIEACRAAGVDLILADKKFNKQFPAVDLNADERFEQVEDRWEKDGVRVYLFRLKL